jgi:tetratricopeptide (TPR) repeat protein
VPPRRPSQGSIGLAAVLAALAVQPLAGCRTSAPGAADTPSPPAVRTPRVSELDRLATEQSARPDASAMAAPPPEGLPAQEVEPRPGPDTDGKRLAPLADVLSQARTPLEPVEPQSRATPESIRLYVTGRTKLLEGKATEALADLEAAARLDPTSATILGQVAEAQLELGRRASAVVTLSNAVRLGLRDARGLHVLGRDALRSRRTEEALGWLAHAASDERAAPELRTIVGVDLAECLEGLGYELAARDALLRALRSPATGITAGRYRAEAAEVFRRRADLWRRAGDLSLRLGEAPLARECYELSAKSPSPDPGAIVPRRVYALMRMGAPAAAARLVIDDIRESGGRVEDRHLPLLAYIAAHSECDRAIAAALGDLTAELGDRATPTARSGLARAAAAVLPADEAARALTRHLIGAPRDRAATTDLLVALGDESVREQTRALAALVAANPDSTATIASGVVALGRNTPTLLEQLSGRGDPAARLLAGVLMTKLDQPERALAHLGQAEPPGTLAPAILAARAGAASDLGDESTLAAVVQRANELAASGAPATARAAAGALVLADRPAEALRHLVPLTEPPNHADPGLLLDIASLHLRSGDPASAEAALKRACEADPLDERPYEALLTLYNTGGPLADSTKLTATARALRQAVPTSRVVRTIAAQELVSRSLWPQAEAALVRLMEPASEDPQDLALLTTIWERAAKAQPDLTAHGERWLRDRLEQRPFAPGLVISLTRVLVALDRAAEAEQFIREKLAPLPMGELARTREWVLREGLEKPDEANAAALERLARAPRTLANVLEHAEVLAASGEFESAAAQFAAVPEGAQISGEQAARLVQILTRLRPDDVAQGGARAAEGALRLFDLIARRGVPIPPALHVARLQLLAAAFPDDTERFLSACREMGRQYPEMREQAFLQGYKVLAELPAAGPVLRFLPVAAREFPKLRDPLLTEWMRLTCQKGDVDDARRLVESDDARALLELLLGARSQGTPIPDAERAQRAELAYQLATEISGLERNGVAVRVYRLALELQPDHGWTSNNLGYLLLESGGDLAEAERLIEVAYRQMPDDYHVVDSLAWVRYKRGHLEDRPDAPGAVSLLRRAEELARVEAQNSGEFQDPTISDHLGDALWRTGDRDGAVKAWSIAADSRARTLELVDAARGDEPGEEPPFVARLRAELDSVKRKLEQARLGEAPAVEPFARP